MTKATPTLIVVIGMHRTGTSLITRGLQVLGVNLGDNLLPAMEEVNAKGFWEDADINAFNIEMLHSLNSEWDSLKPITTKDAEVLKQNGYFTKAVSLLIGKIGLNTLFGLKDPRIATLLPFWVQVFEHCQCNVHYLLSVRNPLSVVKSLQKRDGFSAEKAYLLWFTNVITALSVAGQKSVAVVDYDFFMKNPASELERLAIAFGLPVNYGELDTYINNFVDDTLRHNQFALDDLAKDQACPQLIKDIYTQLLLVARGEISLCDAVIEAQIQEWSQYLAFSAFPFAMYDEATVENLQRAQELFAQSQTLSQQEHIIENLEKFNAERAQQVEDLFLQTKERDNHIEKLNIKFSAVSDELQKFVFSMGQVINEREKKIVQYEEKVGQYEEQVMHDEEKIGQYEEQVMHYEEKVGQYEEKVGQYEEKIGQYEEQVMHYEEKVGRYEEQVMHYEEKVGGYEGQVMKYEEKVVQYEEKMTAQQALIAEYKELADHIWLQLQAEKSEKNQILASRSWRITKPLRFVQRFLQHGLTQPDKRALFVLAQSFHHKTPRPIQTFNRRLYRTFIRPMRNAVIASTNTIIQSESLDTQVLQPAVKLAASSGTDYLMWGVIDWHFRHQRPQQIAQALAGEGHRVFYISSNLVDSKDAGFVVEPLGECGRLFQIKLSVDASLAIYNHAPNEKVIKNLLASVGELLSWAQAERVTNIVQHPFWFPIASVLPNSELVYDCMDHHEGFENTGKEIADLEQQLFRAADLTITTSAWLDDIVSKLTPYRALVRNAGEYEHFSVKPATLYRDSHGRKIIGYYGAIAEWFDVELIAKIANHFSDCCILLVGADTANVKSQLKSCSNVVFTGEVPYKELTHYLYAFDVCMLPFRVIPLTLATNPVKVYEYLGAGKPVVAVDLPEIKQFGSLVKAAASHNEFIEHVSAFLAEDDAQENINSRKLFAQEQTWHHRAQAISQAVDTIHHTKKVSVIIVTYNNIELTKTCLESVEKYTAYDNIEIIVVDNASSDGSPDYLRTWAQQGENRILILNEDNKGFAAGNNVGLLVATGDYLVLLNNDTHVTPGWAGSLVKHMERNPNIGLLGPVTNNIGNEAKINIQYSNMQEMLVESQKFTLKHIGQLTPLRTAAFFCVMISRSAYEKVGLLDEIFGIGFFEDDDYCRRIEQAGLSIYCADDVFIHHHLSASFNKLKVEVRQKLFEQNKVTYEAKWGEWVPHKYRAGVTY